MIKLFDEVTTPSYIFNLDTLHQHIDRMYAIAAGRVSFCYAMKANPLLVKEISSRVEKIEVCSPGELEICKSYGIPGSQIIFSGVNKTAENIAAAMEYGVEVITLESWKHFELVEEYCRTHSCTANVLPRLSSGEQFGMKEELLRKLIADRWHYPFLQIQGIHFFTGTQKKNPQVCIREMEQMEALILSLKEEYGFETKLLEYGAGLSVPYFEGEDREQADEHLRLLAEYIGKQAFPYQVTLELGRYFAAACGSYVTTVEDIKDVESGRNYALVDGGIHHLNYYGQNMAMRVPYITHIPSKRAGNPEGETKDWCICGSLCTFADLLVRKKSLTNLQLGDRLVFAQAGAYSVTEAPYLFLSRKMPDIYFYSQTDGLRLIRRGLETYTINR